MSQNTLRNLSNLSVCAGFLVCLAYGTSAFADQNDSPIATDPPIVTMTAASSSRISQGEPFVVHYKIENIAPEGQLTFHSGPDNDQWYTVTLRGPNGLLIAVPKAPEKNWKVFLRCLRLPFLTVIPSLVTSLRRAGCRFCLPAPTA